MRELHGVMAAHLIDNAESPLKQRALLFDSIHVVGLGKALDDLNCFLPGYSEFEISSNWPERRAELDYLISSGFLVDENAGPETLDEYAQRTYGADLWLHSDDDLPVRGWSASNVRSVACRLELEGSQAVPMFDSIDQFHFGERAHGARSADILNIALQSFPMPGQDSSWEDIFEFREAQHDKQWALRRFLNALTTKPATEAEIRDDIEWSLHEYHNAMAIHKIKAAQSFVDVFVVSPLEMIENLVTFNWSKIAKGALQMRKRTVELMEAEMKAPGRECAYIFGARKRFGPADQ